MLRLAIFLNLFFMLSPVFANSSEQLKEMMEVQPLLFEEYFRQAEELLADNHKILNYLGKHLDRCYFYQKPCSKFEKKLDEFNQLNAAELAQFREISLQLSDSLFNMQVLLRDEKVRDQNREIIYEYNSVMLERILNREENLDRKYGAQAPQYLYQASSY